MLIWKTYESNYNMYLHYSFGKFYCTSDTKKNCVPTHQFFHASAIATGYSRHARDLAIEKEPGSAAAGNADTRDALRDSYTGRRTPFTAGRTLRPQTADYRCC
jgi:hypothetical protein